MMRPLRTALFAMVLAWPTCGYASDSPAPVVPPAPPQVRVSAGTPKVVFAPVAVVNVGEPTFIDATGSVGDKFTWFPDPGPHFKTRGLLAAFATDTPGQYVFSLRAIGVTDGLADEASLTVTLHVNGPPGPVPVPVPPVPPVPVPPVPVPGTKLRAIVLYESAAKMSREHLGVLNSTALRSYLSAHCLDDGGRPAWRVWDKDTDVSKESAAFRSAMNAARAETTQLPKIMLYSGDNTTIPVAIPLPASEAEALDLLRKIGGN